VIGLHRQRMVKVVGNIPKPEWLSLGEARAKAVAFFADAQPAAIEAALVHAFYDGKIKTEGKCRAWNEHDIRVPIDDHVWDPDQVRFGWTLDPKLDCFERTFDGKKFLFVEVYVNRRDLERWLGTRPASRLAAGGATAPPGARNDPSASRRRGPRPVKCEAVLKAMKKSISDHKYTIESLKEATEESLAAEFNVSRTTIRKARTKILSSD
jgi:hypothetical protein